MQDLAAFVRELVVDPLATFVDALHEAGGLELLEVLEERRLAQAEEVAQVRDRLAPHVESFQDPDADVRGERLEALLVQRDLRAAARVHSPGIRCRAGLLKDSLLFGRGRTFVSQSRPAANRPGGLLSPATEWQSPCDSAASSSRSTWSANAPSAKRASSSATSMRATTRNTRAPWASTCIASTSNCPATRKGTSSWRQSRSSTRWGNTRSERTSGTRSSTAPRAPWPCATSSVRTPCILSRNGSAPCRPWRAACRSVSSSTRSTARKAPRSGRRNPPGSSRTSRARRPR